MLLKSKLKKLINKILSLVDLSIEKRSRIKKIEDNHSLIVDFGLLKYIKEHDRRSNYIDNLNYSKSQLRQDLFVLNELNYKKNGFFVEFGATNGVHLSNTYLLEKKFNWDGLLSEPAKIWHKSLLKNRICKIDKNCIWKVSGKTLNFKESDGAEFSTISSFSNIDNNKKLRKNGRTYSVSTLSLEDFLAKHNSPKIIDYLSIDTEGSEYSILEKFDFDKYAFRVITVEHNYTENREKIFNLLSKNGYIRKFEELSLFDDWYVLPKLIS